MSFVRIKIKIYDANQNLQKFWYLLNNLKILTVEELENDLKEILVEKLNYKCDKQLRLYVDDYLLPYWETSTIIRDNDTIT